MFKSNGEGCFKTGETIVKSSSVKDEQKADTGTYVQNALHQHISYSRKGQEDIPAELLRAIKFIIDVYSVPSAETVRDWPRFLTQRIFFLFTVAFCEQYISSSSV